MAIKTIQDYIKEMLNKSEEQKAQTPEEVFPSTNYASQIGAKPLTSIAPMDVELKATYSPLSALGVGIGHILKNLQQVKALNEQQAIKDYETKLKAAQEKDLRQSEYQQQGKMLNYKEQLPSSQAELKSRNISDLSNLQKMSQSEELFPLEKQALQATIAQRQKRAAGPSGEKPLTATQQKVKDSTQFINFYNLPDNDDIKQAVNSGEISQKDAYILAASRAVALPEFESNLQTYNLSQGDTNAMKEVNAFNRTLNYTEAQMKAIEENNQIKQYPTKFKNKSQQPQPTTSSPQQQNQDFKNFLENDLTKFLK